MHAWLITPLSAVLAFSSISLSTTLQICQNSKHTRQSIPRARFCCPEGSSHAHYDHLALLRDRTAIRLHAPGPCLPPPSNNRWQLTGENAFHDVFLLHLWPLIRMRYCNPSLATGSCVCVCGLTTTVSQNNSQWKDQLARQARGSHGLHRRRGNVGGPKPSW